MATLKEVADKAGVSASTVSRVLSGRIPVSEDVKDRVLKIVKEMDYHPNPLAQGLKGASTQTIGLIIPNVRNLVFPATVRGIEDTANRRGYTVILCNTDEDVEKEKFYIENLRRRFIDGFIVCTAKPGHNENLLNLTKDGFPTVFLIRHFSDKDHAVIIDNYRAGYDATKYLISRGLKSIMIVNGNMKLPLYQERFRGYRAAMSDAGRKVEPDFIFNDIDGWEDSYECIKHFLSQGYKPDGVVGSSDPKAIGIIRGIKDFGLRVPEDISVIGIDNADFAQLTDPPLTTIAQPFYDMGVKACERLIKAILGREDDQKVERLIGELVIRKSVI